MILAEDWRNEHQWDKLRDGDAHGGIETKSERHGSRRSCESLYEDTIIFARLAKAFVIVVLAVALLD